MTRVSKLLIVPYNTDLRAIRVNIPSSPSLPLPTTIFLSQGILANAQAERRESTQSHEPCSESLAVSLDISPQATYITLL